MDPLVEEGCAEWRRLALAEGEGIRAGDWTLVAECQSALRRLQTSLGPRLERARGRWAEPEVQREKNEIELRATLASLQEIERQNLRCLAARRRRLSEQVGQSLQSSRNLRRLQESYAAGTTAG